MPINLWNHLVFNQEIRNFLQWLFKSFIFNLSYIAIRFWQFSVLVFWFFARFSMPVLIGLLSVCQIHDYPVLISWKHSYWLIKHLQLVSMWLKVSRSSIGKWWVGNQHMSKHQKETWVRFISALLIFVIYCIGWIAVNCIGW